ncbi:MAG TPA: hypothetical protein VF068_02725 [Rubrobacter sp.]
MLLAANRADALVAGSLTPTISSDQADYPPGATVTLTGSNWQPGETAHMNVNDEAGRIWSRDVDVAADESGAIRDEFQLPNWRTVRRGHDLLHRRRRDGSRAVQSCMYFGRTVRRRLPEREPYRLEGAGSGSLQAEVHFDGTLYGRGYIRPCSQL